MKISTAINSRENDIDNLKGLGILLVVVGHLLQNLTDRTFLSLYNFIYSFHMPLFFFASGLLFTGNSSKTNAFKFTKDKFKRLVFPFFLWHLIRYIFNSHEPILSYFEKLLLHPDNGLWFLWTLFFVYITNYALFHIAKIIKANKWLDQYQFYLLLSGIFFLCLLPVKFTFFGFPQFKYHFIFFSFGAAITRYREFFSKKSLILILFALSIFLEFAYLRLGFISLKFLCGFIIPLTLFLNLNRKRDPLEFLGQRTLEIYAIHFLLLSYVTLPLDSTFSLISILKIFLLTLSLIGLCYLFALLIRKIPYGGSLFFGEK